MASVIFESEVPAKEGTPLMDLLGDSPFKIKVPCGKGKCGKCGCLVSGQVNPPTASERKRFSDKELEQGYRLACEVVVLGEVRVRKAPKKSKK